MATRPSKAFSARKPANFAAKLSASHRKRLRLASDSKPSFASQSPCELQAAKDGGGSVVEEAAVERNGEREPDLGGARVWVG